VDSLKIEASQWRTKLTTPKTEASSATIPVCYPLDSLLENFRAKEGNPANGFILRGEKKGLPLNFDYLSRVVVPASALSCGHQVGRVLRLSARVCNGQCEVYFPCGRVSCW